MIKHLSIGTLLITAAFPHVVLAGPDGCVTSGNVADCSGDQSAGVIEGAEFSAPPVQILTVESTTPITPVAGNAGVDFSGEDAGQIDLTVRAPGGITITGSIASGINAVLGNAGGTSFDGNVSVNSIADIQANGQIVQGISAVTGNGDVNVTSVGNISVHDSNGIGEGIYGGANHSGNVTITSTGAIDVTSIEGIYGLSENGNVSVTSTGPITTAGDSAEGLLAQSVMGNISINNTGDITATGQTSHAIVGVAQAGNASIVNDGNLMTSGGGAAAILASSNGNLDVVSAGDLTVAGPNTVGLIAIQGTGTPAASTVAITSAGDITATGANSTGLSATIADGASATINSAGNITGMNSAVAIEPSASLTTLNLSGGSIIGGTGAAIDIRNNPGADNGLVTINLANDVVLETTTSGIAVVSGAGTTLLSNDGTIRGSVGMSPGSSNQVLNNIGAVFEPSSQIILGAGSYVYNQGLFSPFGSGVLGTTEVTGSFFQSADGTYQVDVSNAGSDSTIVSGQVAVLGTLEINATSAQSSYTLGDQYFILDGAQGISGGFASVTDNLPGFEFVPLISRDRTQVALRVTTNGAVLAPGCSYAGSTITCTGDHADGVTNVGLGPTIAAPGLERLVVNNMTSPITPPSGVSGIDIRASSVTGFTLEADTGVHGIRTTGINGDGIEVRNDQGDVTVQSAGAIETLGTNGDGIVATSSADGNISITSSSAITTARNAYGIVGATRNGDIFINNSGDILTQSDFSRGIFANIAGSGDITIQNSGSIDTLDDFEAETIVARVARDGNISITNTGNLTTDERFLVATIGNSDDGDGISNGSITIVSDATLGPQPGETTGGIEAEVEGDGSIDVTLSGSIATNTFLDGTAVDARVNRNGSVNIVSTAEIISEESSGIRAGAGSQFQGFSGSASVSSTGNITARNSAISASGVESATVHSQGDLQSSSISSVINVNASGNGGTASVNSTGSITQNGSSSGSGAGIALFAGNHLAGAQTSQASVTSVGDIMVTGNSTFGTSFEFPTAGILMRFNGPTDGAISSTGDITTNGENAPGIALIFREFNDEGAGDITITSVGNILTQGDLSDGVRVRNGMTGTTTINLSGGDVTGGTGMSAGVLFGDVAGATGVLNFDGGTLSAASGVAIRGGAGDETVNNTGTIVGNIELGAGANSFDNLVGGRFASGMVVDLGGGELNNSGTLAPGNSIGTTAITGDLNLGVAGTLEIEIDLVSGTAVSDVITITGATTLAGTLMVSAIDVLDMFVEGTTFDIIESAGGITGTFTSLMDTLPDLDIAFEVLAGGTIGQLSLVATDITPPVTGCTPDPVANGGSVTCEGNDNNGFQSVSGDVALTVVNGALVAPAGGDVALSLATGAPTITNAGTVTSTDADAIVLDNGGTVTNGPTGVIRTNQQVVDAAGNTVIENAGLMEAQPGSGVVIDVAQADALITNSGTIRQRGGDGIDVDGSLTLTNTGLITSPSETIRQFGAGNGAATTINNNGTISADSSLGGSGAFGAITLGEDRTLVVNNTGVIESGAGDTPSTGGFPGNSAIKVQGSTLMVENTGAGRIEGADAAILVSNGGVADISNGGTLIGRGGTAVQLDETNAAADQFTLLDGGSVTGNVNMCAGDDVFTLFAGGQLAGVLDMGEGSDRLVFDGAAGTTGTIEFASGMVPFATGVEHTIKQGGGTWVFSGDDVPANVVLAPITIAAGTVILQTNLPGANVTVDDGARVEGAGTVANLDNNGTFAPGGDGAIAQYSLVGNLALGATSVVELDIMSDGSADNAVVAGNAILGGSLLVNALGALGNYGEMDQFLVFDVAGMVSGAFAVIYDNLPDLNAEVDIADAAGGGQDVSLVLVAAEGPNEPPTAVSDKAVHPNAVQSALAESRVFSDLLMGHAARPGSGLAFQPQNTGDNVAMFFAPDAQLGQSKPFFWATGYGANRNVASSAGITGYRATTYGLALGYEHVFDQQDMAATLGFAAGLSQGTLRSGPSSAEVSSYALGVYGSLEQGPLLMSAALSYGIQNYDIRRVIPVGGGSVVARGSAGGSTFAASAKVAYDIAQPLGLNRRNDLRVAPYLRFDHLRANRDAFVETGAGVLNLAAAADRHSQNLVTLGVETSAVFTRPNATTIRPYLDLRWEHVLDGTNATTNSFIAAVPGATFSSAGAPEDRDRLGIGLGISIDTSKNTSFDLRYDGIFSKSNNEHRASVAFKMTF